MSQSTRSKKIFEITNMLPMQPHMYPSVPAASSVPVTQLLEEGVQIEDEGEIQAQVHTGMQDTVTTV